MDICSRYELVYDRYERMSTGYELVCKTYESIAWVQIRAQMRACMYTDEMITNEARLKLGKKIGFISIMEGRTNRVVFGKAHD